MPDKLMNKRQRRLILEMLLIGVVGALSAQLFMFLLRLADNIFLVKLAGYQHPRLPVEGGALEQVIGPHGLWLIPVATTLGGLISGLLVYSFAPEAEGHGTDTAVRAFHRSGGFIRARVPGLKMVASAITIGSGGSAGREGPIALIASGIGSIYATLTRRMDEDRRILVLAGMAAGLSAIFRSPIGTALFAIEVLYGGMEFEAGALLYTMLASVVAYAVNGVFVGWESLFQVPRGLGVSSFDGYGWYVLLGLASGLVATVLPSLFYGLRDTFHAIPIPPHVKPAIGGLGVGLLGLVLPQVLGGGYGWIQETIDGRLAGSALLLLLGAKMVAFSLTVSSGGSGGVFAPSLYLGAMLGGFFARFTSEPQAAFAVVGMAALFGGAARVPIAALLMVSEMTGGYQMLVPAGLAVILSYLVQATLSVHFKYKSLYEAQVPKQADSPAHYLARSATSNRRAKAVAGT
jgi:CIC family chloride channel protein